MAKKKALTARNIVNASLGIRLSSHEKLCAERMKLLIKAIDDLKKNVSKLTEDVSKGKGAVAVLMALGALVIGILGFLNFK